MRNSRALKAGAFAITVLIGSIFAGCADMPDLSEDQNKMVSEYAASLLLKYDSENHSRLVDTTSFHEQYDNALMIQTMGREAYENRILEEENQRMQEALAQSEAQNAYSDLTDSEPVHSSGDGTGGATIISTATIEEFLAIPSFTFTYSGYDIVDSYPENGDDWFFSMDATRGNDLLVLYFDVTNNSDATTLDLFNQNLSFKLSINQEGTISAQKTMLEDDLSEFLGDFAANETKKLVLIAEVKEGTVVNSLSVTVSKHSGGSVTQQLY